MSSLRGLAMAVLAVALAAACYLPALDGEPITEDRLLILTNPATRSPSTALAAFTRPFWHGIMPVQPYYRPLPILTWSIERWLAAPSPEIFHATNIALHGLNAALAAFLVLALARLTEPGGAYRGTSLPTRSAHSRGVTVAGRRLPASGGSDGGVGPAGIRDAGFLERSGVPAFITSPAAGALLAGALVAVHPLHSEPVAALYGRPDLLAATCTLLFLNLAVRGRWLLSLLALAAALLSKESALLMPLLVPAAFATGAAMHWVSGSRRARAAVDSRDAHMSGSRGRNERRGPRGHEGSPPRAHNDARSYRPGHVAADMGRSKRAAIVGIAATAIVLGGYLILRYLSLGTLGGRPPVHPLDNPLAHAVGIERWLTPPAVLARTARLALWPDSLCADRGYDTIPLASGIGDPWALAGGALLVASLMVVVLLGVRRSPWALPAGAALLSWFPASNLIVMAPVLMAERLAYMPSIFLCVMVGGACASLLGQGGKSDGAVSAWVGSTPRGGTTTGIAAAAPRPHPVRRAITSTIAAVVVLALAVLAGRTYLRASDFQTEISFYESDTRACPRSVKAHYNLGNALSRAGRHEEAVQAFERATNIAPALAMAHSNRGGSYLAMNRIDEAEAAYRQALEADPGLVASRASLAGILYMRGQLDAALTEAESALLSNPAPGDAAQIRELIDRIRMRLDKAPRPPAPTQVRPRP